jgi:hypothetical protein
MNSAVGDEEASVVVAPPVTAEVEPNALLGTTKAEADEEDTATRAASLLQDNTIW